MQMKMNKKKRRGTFLIAGGLLLIVAALLLTAYNLVDERRASSFVNDVIEQLEPVVVSEETQSEEILESVIMNPGEMEIPDYMLNLEMDMPETVISGRNYIGVLGIPSLGLRLPVISEWSYPDLKSAPCRYDGSAYQDNMIIAAHNYRSHFGRLNELAMGEEISFTDLDKNKFTYVVTDRITLMPDDIKGMKSGEWDLTLFTCTLGGQYRITVRCERKE